MMHPVGVSQWQDHDEALAPARSGWWALVALVVIVALLVTAVVALSGGESAEEPVQPQPTEAPFDPGA